MKGKKKEASLTGLSKPARNSSRHKHLRRGEVPALDGHDEGLEPEHQIPSLGIAVVPEEEVDDGLWVGGVVRDEEPTASAGLLFFLQSRSLGFWVSRGRVGGRRGRVGSVGEDGDAAGAGAGSEEGGVAVDGVEERDDGGVHGPLGGLVRPRRHHGRQGLCLPLLELHCRYPSSDLRRRMVL